ncbi:MULTISPECIES: S1 RNA-binding domain-containing protein [Bacillaceae]|uniref:S1 motif domain-containing protein n=1 Tax=Evansella alkalicola TaxID=745819 RepID=A0ABS6JRP3_9BACI|nr:MULTISPECIES: S1-like domain-containing RNA-binding protein [Bacillaceae]MBU9721220.1 hypothetical protein [Bacillus alkalicola]
MSKLHVGATYELTVKRKIETGYVLTDGKEEILLHNNEVTKELNENDEVDVFLYHNKKDLMVATMSIPELDVDTYDWVQVVSKVQNLGVFVDIGIQKEILVFKDDLPLMEEVWPDEGDELFITLDLDRKGKLLGKPVTEEIIDQERDRADKTILNKTIGGRVYNATKIGSFIITENGYRGFIHASERKREPRLGEWVEGRVIDVKEDGTINVSLRPLKQEGMVEDADLILDFMKNSGGSMPYHDKSDPEEIRETFQLSKAAFKRALGKLMKEKKVEQRDGQTVIINK